MRRIDDHNRKGARSTAKNARNATPGSAAEQRSNGTPTSKSIRNAMTDRSLETMRVMETKRFISNTLAEGSLLRRRLVQGLS